MLSLSTSIVLSFGRIYFQMSIQTHGQRGANGRATGSDKGIFSKDVVQERHSIGQPLVSVHKLSTLVTSEEIQRPKSRLERHTMRVIALSRRTRIQPRTSRRCGLPDAMLVLAVD